MQLWLLSTEVLLTLLTLVMKLFSVYDSEGASLVIEKSRWALENRVSVEKGLSEYGIFTFWRGDRDTRVVLV